MLRFTKHLAASMLVAFATAASAAPVTYDFSLTASEGSATGSFTADDLDSRGIFALGELLSFEIDATGTAFTGGPIIITAAEAMLHAFSFDIATMVLSFDVDNGAAGAAFGKVGCLPSCSVGSTLHVEHGARGGFRAITNVTITTLAVPEPASLLLVGSAMALAGLAGIRRRRKRLIEIRAASEGSQ